MLGQDEKMELEIREKGLTFPRVTLDEINALLERVEYDVHVCEGTTTTVVTAFLPIAHMKWSICTEIMACVDSRNFNAEFGRKHGIEKAAKAATQKLWELQGFALALNIEQQERARGLANNE